MNSVAPAPALLTELDLGSARGGKRPALPLDLAVVRSLAESDLPALQAPPPVAHAVPQVKQLRHSHHRLAELVAKGISQVEISLVTGYSQSYISNIKRDPAFAELVAYYEHQKASIFADAQERLRTLGLDATEKLHEQLHDPGQAWSKRELMELIDMALVKPAVVSAKAGQGQGSGSALSLEVKFVGAQPREPGPTIETSYTEIPQSKEVSDAGE